MSMLIKALLKALGVGSERGSEEDAQKLWIKYLGDLGFKPDQAFPDNMTKGTDRVFGNVKTGRKTSIMHHIFNPTFYTRTYYDLEHGVPLYSRTKGVISKKSELVLWAGIVGMRDVVGNRFPREDDDRRTDIYREGHPALGGKKQQPIMIEASKILSQEGKEFTGEKPDKMPKFKSEDEQEDWIETNYPEWHKWLVENLHLPVESIGYLEDLGVSKDRADLLALVAKITPKGLFDKLLDDAVKEDNEKWQIVIIANKKIKGKIKDRGFVSLFSDNYAQDIIDSDEVSEYIKTSVKKLQSKEGELSGEDSEYFIRAPQGKKIKPKVSKWLNNLKRNETMFDDINKEDGDWYEVLKAKDDDEKGSSKKPRNPDKEGDISEREVREKDLWAGDWEVDDRMKPDKLTGRKKTAPKSEKARSWSQENSNCCIIIKDAIGDYIELSDPDIKKHFGREGINRLIDESLPCMDMEREWNLQNENVEEIIINFNGRETISGDYYEGDGTIILDPLKKAPFDRYAGQLTLLPKKRWEKEDMQRDRHGDMVNYGGDHLNLVEQFLRCEEGQMSEGDKKPLNLRTGDDADVLEAFSDKGLDEIEHRRLKKKIEQIWVQRFGGRNIQREAKVMEKIWPHGHALYWNKPGTHKLADGEVSLSEKTEEEFIRERVDDYIDEIMRWKKGKPRQRDRYGYQRGGGPQIGPAYLYHNIDSPQVKRDYLSDPLNRGIPDPKGSGKKRVIIWIMDDTPDQQAEVSRLKGLIAQEGYANKVGWKSINDADDATLSKINDLGVIPVLQHGQTFIPGSELGEYLRDLFG